MATNWWDQWPDLKPDHVQSVWARNYALYWGKTAPDFKPERIVSRRLEHIGCRVHVFPQYETLSAQIRAHRLAAAHRRSQRPPSRFTFPPQDGPVLIFGAPGIGKSVFLEYYAVRLMEERTPFVLYHCHAYYVFTPDGVKRAKSIPDEPEELFSAAANVPFLIYSVDSRQELPCGIVLHHSFFFFIQASSPSPENYKWLQKRIGHRVLTMVPHPKDEVVHALRHLGLSKSDEALRSAVEAYGPNIRIVIRELLNDSLPENSVCSAVRADSCPPSKSLS